MAHVQLVRLLRLDLLLLLLCQLIFVLQLLRPLGDARLAVDAVVGFVAAALTMLAG